MTHRFPMTAVLLAVLAVPAAAQQTTTPDTSAKSNSGATVNTSNGAIADSAAGATTAAPAPGATVTTPAPSATPMTAEPAPSPGATVTTPAPSAAPENAAPNAAVSPSTDSAAAAAKPAEGQVTPHAAAKVDVKVAESLASTVKVSGDSAFALARQAVPGTDISSADLEMKNGRLVYEIKMIGDNESAYEVHVDAMSGEVTKDKRYGGAKALIEHANEHQKLEEAKGDSTAKKP